jgi:DNA-binding Lrp family transcriptional regulator
MENDIEKKIIKTLLKHAEGITIVDISKGIGVHRNTVSKYIFGLVKEGVVTQRRIGVVSICYLNENFVRKFKKGGGETPERSSKAV